MARPFKSRRVAFLPGVNFYKPAGIPMKDLEEIVVTLEEIEAIRLKDMEKLEQEEAAAAMGISRPTFQRVLLSAREKIATALLQGKAIRIEGGNFQMSYHRFRCRGGHEWESDFPVNSLPGSCPACRTTDIRAIFPAGTGYGHQHRHGRDLRN